MDQDQSYAGVQSPMQRAVVFASFACFISFVSFYCVARPAVELLGVYWAEWLIYAVIPIAVTFFIMYRSCWHPEITRAARAGAVFLLSGVILISVLIATGFMLGLIWFCVNAVVGGNH